MRGCFNQGGQEKAVCGEDISAESSERVSFECDSVVFLYTLTSAGLSTLEKHEERGDPPGD